MQLWAGSDLKVYPAELLPPSANSTLPKNWGNLVLMSEKVRQWKLFWRLLLNYRKNEWPKCLSQKNKVCTLQTKLRFYYYCRLVWTLAIVNETLCYIICFTMDTFTCCVIILLIFCYYLLPAFCIVWLIDFISCSYSCHVYFFWSLSLL